MTSQLCHSTFFERILILLILVVSPICVLARNAVYSGVVRDSVSREPVPYASVMLKSVGWGKLTDEKGRFKISVNDQRTINDTIHISAMGYTARAVPVNGEKKLEIYISPDGVRLNEVVVRPKKEKYSKKNNPAVDLVNNIRNSQDHNDPRRNDYYSFDKYERITIALNNISPDSDKNLILKKFGVLKEHIDTSEISGKPILNISTREKKSNIFFRKNPHAEKEHIDGLSQSGLDDFLDEANMRTLYEDFFSDIDLYQNDIYLLHNKFVSPLSKIGPDFYKYYLTDTTYVGADKCIELSFVPHNSQAMGFTGKIYCVLGDSTMFIRKIVMSVPKDINLNFIERIYINQEYQRAPDGSRLLVKDDLTAEVSIMPGTQGLYFRRNTAYGNHSFEPSNEWYVYEIPGKTVLNSNAKNRDENYWASNRLVDIRDSERNVGKMAEDLRRIPFYYWAEKIVKIFATGYINTSKDSKFDIGPVNTTVSHNSVEGWRLRLGGMTTANLSKRMFIRGYGAYGLKDHKWKYEAQAEYSFVDKEYHPREFPIHALRLTHRYDVDMLGQHYAFTNADNMFLSFKRREDYQMTYLRQTRLDYILELRNGFSINAAFRHQRQEASPYMRFVTDYGRVYNHYNESGFEVTLRFAPGERFYQTKTSRISISPELPVVTLSHLYCPKGFLGNMFDVNRTELSFSQRFWFSAFGYLDTYIKAAHLWSVSPYPDLLIPNANLSYTIQPDSFDLMNPMEFINDSYVTWDMTYWANGTILNYIPLLKKLKLREAFSFRGVWGHLSKRNNPENNRDLFRFPTISDVQPMGRMPYMEAAVGVDNIFKILRVDYVWRLTYRDRPGIDKGGVRIQLHFTF